MLLGFGLVCTSAGPLLAYSIHMNESEQHERTYQSLVSVMQVKPASSEAQNLTTEGSYLYGRSSEPGKLGSEYLVFEVREGKVIGAFYMPSSEFDCFYGTIDKQQLKLAIVDPNEQTTYPFTIALDGQSQAAGTESADPVMNLKGYQKINNLSDNDLRILNTCVDTHHQEVWN
ncbi:MAG: hypothetical protein F6K24_40485 [Okeania sp. SIO2D1]|nr:hypothetical protein [Okeania sp. SIO2D1]